MALKDSFKLKMIDRDVECARNGYRCEHEHGVRSLMRKHINGQTILQHRAASSASPTRSTRYESILIEAW